MRPAFLFDPDRCTGCEACRIACGIENNGGADTGWRTITTFNPSRHPALPTRHLSMACNHCDTPACAIGCPANAYARDAKTGAVLLDPEKCIGCRYCSWVCPYDAPAYDEGRGVMTKCTFCAPRIAEGGQPACTAACPTGSLSFGSRGDGEPEPAYHGLEPSGLGPALRIEKPRLAGPPPALAIDELLGNSSPSQPAGTPVIPKRSEGPWWAGAFGLVRHDTVQGTRRETGLGVPSPPGPSLRFGMTEGAALDPPSQPLPKRKIALSAEWTLLLFTVVMPALVAWLGGGIVRYGRTPPLLFFAGLGALAMALSTAHLGKPLRAWRAILNVRTSWLSREIVFASLFLLFGMPFTALPHASSSLGIPALAFGIALAFSIDGVYRAIPRPGAKRMHSAEAVPTVALLFGIAASSPVVTVAAALVKIVLYASRWVRRDAGVPEPFGVLRMVLLGMACAPTMPWHAAFGLALLGEVIDRAAFYNALEPASPARRMALEVRASAP